MNIVHELRGVEGHCPIFGSLCPPHLNRGLPYNCWHNVVPLPTQSKPYFLIIIRSTVMVGQYCGPWNVFQAFVLCNRYTYSHFNVCSCFDQGLLITIKHYHKHVHYACIFLEQHMNLSEINNISLLAVQWCMKFYMAYVWHCLPSPMLVHRYMHSWFLKAGCRLLGAPR